MPKFRLFMENVHFHRHLAYHLAAEYRDFRHARSMLACEYIPSNKRVMLPSPHLSERMKTTELTCGFHDECCALLAQLNISILFTASVCVQAAFVGSAIVHSQ